MDKGAIGRSGFILIAGPLLFLMNFLQQIRDFVLPKPARCNDSGIEHAYDPMYLLSHPGPSRMSSRRTSPNAGIRSPPSSSISTTSLWSPPTPR